MTMTCFYRLCKGLNLEVILKLYDIGLTACLQNVLIPRYYHPLREPPGHFSQCQLTITANGLLVLIFNSVKLHLELAKFYAT